MVLDQYKFGRRWVVRYKVYYDGSMEQRREISTLVVWYDGIFYGPDGRNYMKVEVSEESAGELKNKLELFGYKVEEA